MPGTTVRYGYDSDVDGWWVPRISNMHGHLRGPDDPRFKAAIMSAASQYCFYTAMPNLGKDRIRTPEQAIEYRRRIHEASKEHAPDFHPIVPLYLEPDTKPETVSKGYGLGAWICAKLYSKGATTQSVEGVDFRFLEALYPVFKAMQQLNMMLLIHLEPVAAHDDSEIDPWHREREGIAYLVALAEAFPKLKIVFEHISSRYGIEAVRELQRRGFPVEATIAPQYLIWTRAELVRGGMNPVAFSIPVLKEEEDRKALVDFMLGGGGFLGTDSAPHTVRAKSQPCGCPGGVFNDPVAISVYFDIFKTEGKRRGIEDWFDRFIAFACTKGPAFYGLPLLPGRALIKHEPWLVPERYGEGDDAIIPMLAGETTLYQVALEAA